MDEMQKICKIKIVHAKIKRERNKTEKKNQTGTKTSKAILVSCFSICRVTSQNVWEVETFILLFRMTVIYTRK